VVTELENFKKAAEDFHNPPLVSAWESPGNPPGDTGSWPTDLMNLYPLPDQPERDATALAV
jgi:hypothetical protein